MTEELLSALQMIKDQCVNTEDCKDCPICKCNGNCGVYADYPENWKLEKKEEWF